MGEIERGRVRNGRRRNGGGMREVSRRKVRVRRQGGKDWFIGLRVEVKTVLRQSGEKSK